MFAAMAKATVPFPLPLAPEVRVNQESLLIAVHAQPVVVVTPALLELAVAAGFNEVGDTVNVQGTGAPACVTVTVWPATVSVPVRGDVAVLAAMAKPTVPFPLPLAPDVMLSQEALLVAVHVHPVAAVTLLLLELALAPGLSDVGETVYVQATPACVTVTVWPATVSVPVRGEVAVLAAMAKATVPFPLPLAPDVIVSQESLLVAVQVQPVVVVTLALLDPAVAAGLNDVGETVYVQATPACVTVTV